MTRIKVLSSYKPVPGFQGDTVGQTAVTKIEKIRQGFSHYSSYTFCPICEKFKMNLLEAVRDFSKSKEKQTEYKILPLVSIVKPIFLNFSYPSHRLADDFALMPHKNHNKTKQSVPISFMSNQVSRCQGSWEGVRLSWEGVRRSWKGVIWCQKGVRGSWVGVRWSQEGVRWS